MVHHTSLNELSGVVNIQIHVVVERLRAPDSNSCVSDQKSLGSSVFYKSRLKAIGPEFSYYSIGPVNPYLNKSCGLRARNWQKIPQDPTRACGSKCLLDQNLFYNTSKSLQPSIKFKPWVLCFAKTL